MHKKEPKNLCTFTKTTKNIKIFIKNFIKTLDKINKIIYNIIVKKIKGDYKMNKELIKKYAELYSEGDEKWYEYEISHTAAVIELNDGLLIAIEKPKIQKDFCFARDYNGISTEESEQNADDMAEYASAEASYFLNKNLCPLIEEYKRYCPETITEKEILNNWHLSKAKYQSPAVHGQKYIGHDPRIAYIEFYDDPEKICGSDDKKPDDFRWLEPNEIEAIKKAYKEVIENFKKRLATYLKKYGLTKLNIWTFYSN